MDIPYVAHLLGSILLLRVVGKTTGLWKSFFTLPPPISTAVPNGDSDGGLALGSVIKIKTKIKITRTKISIIKKRIKITIIKITIIKTAKINIILILIKLRLNF